MRWLQVVTACSLLAACCASSDAVVFKTPFGAITVGLARSHPRFSPSLLALASHPRFSSSLLILASRPIVRQAVLDHDAAPGAVSSLLDAARRRVQGRFERAEARPEIPDAPEGPYALLQGSFDDELMNIPQEGTRTTIRSGDLVLIPDTRSFYIALENHDSWARAHSVIGSVTRLTVVDTIVIQSTHEFVHPEYRTKMRMMDDPVYFELTTDVTDTAMISSSHRATTA